MRNRFDKELFLLNEELIEMGSLVEAAIKTAVTALKEQDVELAKRVIEGDREVNEIEKDIERRCLKLLLQEQPVAGDFRLISSALKMITDMERIGDMAQDIAEISIHLANETYLKEIIHIPQMADATIKMVKESIDSFVSRDLKLVERVIKYDDIVDELFDIIKDELIHHIRTNMNSTEQAIDFLMIAKYFERIGDHAENIAEWVYYGITGKHYV